MATELNPNMMRFPMMRVFAGLLLVLWMGAPVLAESENAISMDGMKFTVDEKGVCTWIDPQGRNLLEMLQLRPAESARQIVSYAYALVPEEKKVDENNTLLLDFKEPFEAQVRVRFEREPSTDGSPEGISLVFERGTPWPANTYFTASGRPFPEGFVLPGRMNPDPAARVTFATTRVTVNGVLKTSENTMSEALFDRSTDCMLYFQGNRRLNAQRFDIVLGETGFRITWLPDYYKKQHGITYYKPVGPDMTAPPAGWCSWYYYYLDITEEEMKKNTDWLAENLKPYGLEYVQLDDGYQLLAADQYQAKSWIRWNEKFPSGCAALADYIHERGFKAGLWLTPFSQGDDDLVAAHPDWFLTDSDGEVVRTFKGAMTVDASRDEVLDEWFSPLFRTLAQEAGYDYFKIDGQPEVVRAYQKNEARFGRAMTGHEAYRRGLERIRKEIGPERFLLNCWGTAPEGVGFVNAARTGGDVAASWMGILPAKRATEAWYYTHNVCWYADPDVVCVRPPLTPDQATLWVSLMGLTGQLLMASDKMYDLPEDRVELLRRIYPVMPTYPMEFYPLAENQLEVVNLKINKFYHNFDVVGFFNWERNDRTITVSLDQLGLKRADYAVYDFWNHTFLGVTADKISLNVPKQGCRLVSLNRAILNRPNLVATSRHITMGGVDIIEKKWSSKYRTLTGKSTNLVALEPYTLSFYLPDNRFPSFEVTTEEALESQTFEQKGRALDVTFVPQQAGDLTWKFQFKKEEPPAPLKPLEALVPSESFEAEPTRIRFAWAVEGLAPAAYMIEKNGVVVGTVFEPSWLDDGLEPDHEYTYTVRAQGFHEQPLPEKTDFTVKVRTPPLPPPPPEPDVYLGDLTPVSAEQGWGTLGIDKSTEGNQLKIGGQSFDCGLGTHARSEIVYKIEPEYEKFTACVGVDQETPYGSVVFEVWLDGEKVFSSPQLLNGDPPLPVIVPVAGKREMKLVVTDGGDNIHYDHADWARSGFVIKK